MVDPVDLAIGNINITGGLWIGLRGDFDDLVAQGGEDAVAAGGGDDGATGEGAKGGEHEKVRAQPETRQAQLGAAAVAEAENGVEVAGELKAAGGGGVGGVVDDARAVAC